MHIVNASEGSLQLFLNGFAARDLAESLASFDDTTSPKLIRAAMAAQHLDVAGIRESGVVAGWIGQDDVGENQETLVVRPFDASSVIVDTASLNEVVQALDAAPHLFVRSFGEINGIIGRRDLQRPAMRMWLFGLVTTTELRVTQMIDEFCPRDSWQQYLSEGRLQNARELQQQRQQRGQRPSLLDCLQFADKGQIVARDATLRNRTRFASRRKVEEFVAALQDLRNNLAHSQDLGGDWEVIRDLASHLHQIVLGPEKHRPA